MDKVKVVMMLFVVTAAAAALSGGEAIHYEAEKIFNCSDKAIFLLAGQSNMAGRGGTYNKAQQWDGRTPSLCQSNRRILRARASLRAGGSLRGMLWYQGENDCKPGLAKAYEDKLKDLFNSIRNDLMLPSLPIIQVALDLPDRDPNVKKVRSAQLELKLPNLRSVDGLGLLLNGDNLHLTTDSQVTLGSKLAKEFLKYFN